MYRVRLLYDVKGWAYYHRCVALQKYAPPDFEVTIGGDYGAAFKEKPYDLVLQLCYGCAKDVRRHIQIAKYNMVVVTGFNVSSQVNRDWYLQAAKHSDHIIINSRACWEGLKRPPESTWISNGVDREVFACRTPFADRSPKVISLGSKFHRRNKGFTDVLPQVEDRLRSLGIATDFRCVDSHGKHRVSHEELARWYNTATVYIVASQHEGTPNPALEAASCGCTLVSTPVGNMPELLENDVNGCIVHREASEIVAAVQRVQERYQAMAAATQRAIEPWHWRTRSQEYYGLFRSLIDARRRGR